MIDTNLLLTAQKSLEDVQSILVMLPPLPSEDMVNAALGLHLSLIESGKTSQIGCSSPIEVDSKIQAVEEIKDSVGSRNLTIAFDFLEEHLDKVDYDVKNDGKFFLVIKPKANAPIPDVSHVKYSYSGAQADLVVTLGIFSLEELGKLYSDEKAFLDQANILSLNISPRPAPFATQSLHQNYSSYVELVGQLLQNSHLSPSSIASQNLLYGLYAATDDLNSTKVSSQTFSLVAYLIDHGAKTPSQAISHRPVHAPFFDVPTFSPPINHSTDLDTVPTDWKQPKIFRASDDQFEKTLNC